MSRVWYDLNPSEPGLWIVEGPQGYDVDSLDPQDLPQEFIYIDDDEWHARRDEMLIVRRQAVAA